MFKNIKTAQDLEKDRLETLASNVRAQRNKLLQEADVLIYKLEDSGNDTIEARAYRQALRDVPNQSGFPENVEWPVLV